MQALDRLEHEWDAILQYSCQGLLKVGPELEQHADEAALLHKLLDACSTVRISWKTSLSGRRNQPPVSSGYPGG